MLTYDEQKVLQKLAKALQEEQEPMNNTHQSLNQPVNRNRDEKGRFLPENEKNDSNLKTKVELSHSRWIRLVKVNDHTYEIKDVRKEMEKIIIYSFTVLILIGWFF